MLEKNINSPPMWMVVLRFWSRNRSMAVGKSFGLELNLAKTVLLRHRGSEDIAGFDGKHLRVKTEAIYLGGLISI